MSAPESASPSSDRFLSRRRFLETSAVIAGALGLADAATGEAAQQKPAGGTTPNTPVHPLDPLTPDEIVRAVEIVRKARNVDDSWRFVTVTLAEPGKKTVKTFKPGGLVPRQAFVIAIDRSHGRPYEGLVDLVKGVVDRFDPLPAGLQPSITLDEFSECEEAIKRSPDFLAALKKRGATDVQLVMVDPWSAGMYGTERPEDRGKRLSRALAWVRSEAGDNGYARPLDGVVAVVDLNTMQVVRVEDYGVIPLPPEAGNWHRSYQKEFCEPPRPLQIVQPDGPSFAVDGYEVAWQKWKFRIGFTPREGLVLHNITYTDAGRERPIIYRAAICEMVVPYGDPDERHYRKNAFDIGEYGIGMFANSLELGCDCLGTIRYFDARMNDSRGQPVTIKNAVCLHEDDVGLLWKHTDWRTNQSETRRSRRLAVSFVATVGNYEYGFFWYLYQDGNIQCEVKLTGIMHTTTVAPGEKPAFGTLVAPQLNAPFHEHIFAARLDMAVDGEENSIYEVNTVSLPSGPDNPYGNAFRAEHSLLAKESQAQRSVNGASARYWRIVNPNKTNRIGEPVAYRLIPGENAPPFVRPDAAVMRRAGFIAHQLWVTPYDRHERYAAGDYPNQHPTGDGLPIYTAADRSLVNTDLVVWYVFGHNHVPRLEDWPVMPVASLGFFLKPDGFFERNPALDLPPPDKV
ncbi:MAG: primary-amine oxidase [Planctomycetaceae bacterium]|nr:primary-amine oxidase [Planctomycetaceae bacterium]